MTLKRRFLIATGAFAVATGAFAQGADPTGVWMTQAGDAQVRVSRCGGALCGTIVSVRDRIDPATGRPVTDNKNPNPALKNRPMVGLPLFTDMRPSGPGKWSGHIYNADDGSIYVSNISLAANALHVEGCVGPLCGGETWTRTGR